MHSSMDFSWPQACQESPAGNRPQFTQSTLELSARISPTQSVTSFGSDFSLTPLDRAKKHAGFSAAKTRLTDLLVDLGIPYEIFSGRPCPCAKQEIMHMIASASPDKQLLLFEYAFGFLALRTLCVNSKWNLAPTNKSLHHTIDAHHAFLMPCRRDLDYMSNHLANMLEFRDSNPTSEVPETLSWERIQHCGLEADKAIHPYQYIPFGFSYHKLHPPPPPISQYNPETSVYETHHYPYTTLPPLRSHISPFFVLANFYVKFFAWAAHPEQLVVANRSLLVSVQSQGLVDDDERLYCFKKMIDLVRKLNMLDFTRSISGRWNPPAFDDGRELFGCGPIRSFSTPSSSPSSSSSCGSNANSPGHSTGDDVHMQHAVLPVTSASTSSSTPPSTSFPPEEESSSHKEKKYNSFRHLLSKTRRKITVHFAGLAIK